MPRPRNSIYVLSAGQTAQRDRPEGARGLSQGLNGAKIRAVWDRSAPRKRTVAISPGFQPRHRLEAYATLTPSRDGRGARNPRQKAFRRALDTPEDQCSIGFQPVSGFATGNTLEIMHASQPLNPQPLVLV
jgi:hypothetical protein